MHPGPERLCGIVLAAGSGTRFGGPKAFARRDDGVPWLGLAVDALRAGGCGRVLVALSATSSAAAALAPADVTVVVIPDAADGLGATLRGALAQALGADVDAVVILPVDTPGVAPSAIRRVIAEGRGSSDALVQATYRGRPGHPVLIGRDHVESLRVALSGDAGARGYLVSHGVREVDCADLWSGEDVDEQPDRAAAGPA
ncbi:nucleotidyltransferase family protein [Microbacterium rhizophilus]|uniref:nucleotidyltransferase family protein n=1 Tax=Microbacterium rhizophilus TaxID=3138934 RepID=UPI0031E54418